MNIALDEMRAKLHPIDYAYTVLGRTEPMQPKTFSAGDAGLRFSAEPGWNHGAKAKDGNEPVGVYVTLDLKGAANEYQLTKSTLEETCVAFGFKREYPITCPAELLIPHMNYWFREGLLDQPKRNQNFQFLIHENNAVAFARQSLMPFSNLALLDQAVAGIQAKYGNNVEILTDYKLSHTLRSTYLRLIVPEASRTLTDTGTDDDLWTLGVSIKNSLTGTIQTSIERYLFRYVCTNGQIDTRASSGVWTRRKGASESEVYQWAREAVDQALAGAEGAFEAVQALTELGIEGSLADTIRDVFEHYSIPIHQRPKIIKILEDYDGEITMYVVMNAITQVANESGLEPGTVEKLLLAGGDLPHTAHQRCGACRRLLHAH